MNSSGEPLLPQPQGNTPGPAADLPNPELNPLLNPTLGRNLGRWAQAYFTSPPEKREQAVLELLRELEAESGPREFERGSTDGVSETSTTPESVVCAECGHKNTKPHRFCGMCGSPLTFDDGISASLRSAAVTPDAAETDSPVVHHPVFPTLSLFATVDAEPTPSSGHGASEIQWLRDENLRQNALSLTRKNAGKYVLALLGVLLAGGFFYHQSQMQRTRVAESPAASRVPRANRNPAQPNPPESGSSPSTLPTPSNSSPVVSGPAVLDPASSAGPKPPEPSVRDPVGKQPVPISDPGAPISDPGAKRVALNSTEPIASDGASGSLELAMAEDFLRGKKRPRDSAEAAKFLWKAVSKENTTAILLLSDLYLAGDGVPKSCDQARLLLKAAARKNVPGAGGKLRDLLVSGCP